MWLNKVLNPTMLIARVYFSYNTATQAKIVVWILFNSPFARSGSANRRGEQTSLLSENADYFHICKADK